MINHGLSTGALFLLVGMVYERRHTRQIAELSGLQKSVPVLAGVFLVVMMSSVGLPGLNGFVGEFLVLIGTFITHRWWAVVGATGVILAAVYLLWAYQRVFQGVPSGANATMPDMSWRDRAVMAPLLILIVFLGVYPKPALERIQPSVDHLLAHVRTVDPGLHVPKSGVGPAVAVSPADNVDGPRLATATSASQAAAGGSTAPAPGTPNGGNR
jgi:NADH-quinone oxidoreductase subunit M